MEPETLFDLSLEVGCHMSPESYLELPPFLKERILMKLTKRGLCTDIYLRTLIHNHLSEIDLRDCCISEQNILLLEGLSALIILYLPEPPTVSTTAYSETALIKVLRGKKDLMSLGMNSLRGVTDRVIGALVGGSPDILRLHIQETSITNHALFCIGNLSSLQCLNIARTEITDIGVEQLASGSASQSLMELKLDGCSGMTIHGIKILLKKMCQLNILYFHLCPNMSVTLQLCASTYLCESSYSKMKYAKNIQYIEIGLLILTLMTY